MPPAKLGRADEVRKGTRGRPPLPARRPVADAYRELARLFEIDAGACTADHVWTALRVRGFADARFDRLAIVLFLEHYARRPDATRAARAMLRTMVDDASAFVGTLHAVRAVALMLLLTEIAKGPRRVALGQAPLFRLGGGLTGPQRLAALSKKLAAFVE
jgi:hypothetical protein